MAAVSGFLIGPAGAIAAIFASYIAPLLVEERGQAATMAFLAIPLILSWLIAWFLPRADKTQAGDDSDVETIAWTKVRKHTLGQKNLQKNT